MRKLGKLFNRIVEKLGKFGNFLKLTGIYPTLIEIE